MKASNIFSKSIVVLDKQLTPHFCRHVIDKYEQELSMTPGKTFGGRRPEIKQSSDLCITHGETAEAWTAEDKIFEECVANAIFKYYKILEKRMPGLYKDPGNFFDTGYQVQRTTPGGFYDWHSDCRDSRRLTFIWYLNDIKKGGYTEFCDGTKVQPKAGRMLIFPATAQYLHRGVAPKKDIKYIVTGWLYDEVSHDKILLRSSGLQPCQG